MAATNDAVSSIAASLTASHLPPTPAFLQTLPRSTAPLRAQQQTARFHLLRAHLPDAVAASPTNTFPATQPDADAPATRLRGPLPVQVLDVEDVGRSRWAQVEALEALERGEGRVGRQIVRLDERPDEAGGERPAGAREPARAAGPHRLVLVDAAGRRLFGVERRPVRGVGVDMMIGAKLLLQDVLVARGVVMLEPASCEVLGGKVEELQKAWEEGRKERLMAAIREHAES